MSKSVSIKTKTFVIVTAAVILPFLALALILCNLAFWQVKQHTQNLVEELTVTVRDEIEAELQSAQADPESIAAVSKILDNYHFSECTVMKDFLERAFVLQNFDNLALALIISICFIAVLLYFITTHITNPILALTNTAKAIGEGNFDADVPVSHDTYEIGVLSSAFKTMAENLINAKKHAEESSRAKGEFLSNMSHEMRTPLNAIIGMTAIGKSAADPEKKGYSFEKIEEASTHLLSIINDVLDMSKIEANKMELSPEEFDFEAMVHKVVNVINYRIHEKDQNFHVSIDKNIPGKLVGDDNRLTQVILNMLSNAVKFTPVSGSIWLDARLAGDENGVFTIQFTTTDTGIGISPEQQALLFNAFQQADSGTSRKFGGTGLGLVISKRIVEMMGGEIHLESELGKGTSFIFTVKLKKSMAEQRKLLNPDVNWKNIRILTVDNNAENLDCFREIAGRFGISCDTVQSGEEAIALLDLKKQYDISFIAWKMPGMNSIELARKIKERTAGNTVIIMVSPIEWSIIADEAKAAGVNRFLPKPILPSDIVDCINDCLCIAGRTGDVSRTGDAGTTGDSSPAGGDNGPVIQDTFPGCRILLAEDVDINREIILTLLEPAELEIDIAENGEEALRLFSENPNRYDMIFMDMQMPEMDGLEATRRIRAVEEEINSCSFTPAYSSEKPEAAPRIPIVAMTANVFREDIENCIAAGMDDHVGKPLDMDIVLEKLRKYLPCTAGKAGSQRDAYSFMRRISENEDYDISQ